MYDIAWTQEMRQKAIAP